MKSQAQQSRSVSVSYKGFFYALAASSLNATVGIFSVQLLSNGLSSHAVVFYKFLIAFLMMTGWLVVAGKVKEWILYMKRLWPQLAIAALFGFFVLSFFETAAYQFEKVSIVVFMLLGSSVITTFILSSLFNKRWMRLQDVLSCSVAILGLGLIFGVHESPGGDSLGMILALIAGVGYGIFLTISPQFKLGSGLLMVNSLMLFATIYLFIPFGYDGFAPISDWKTALLLVFAALFPTVIGFLCTAKALTLIKSESVQLIELSEPIFALVLSLIFLGQSITLIQIAGGLLLIFSVYINLLQFNKNRDGPVVKNINS